jgi:hypothetical protein
LRDFTTVKPDRTRKAVTERRAGVPLDDASATLDAEPLHADRAVEKRCLAPLNRLAGSNFCPRRASGRSVERADNRAIVPQMIVERSFAIG